MKRYEFVNTVADLVKEYIEYGSDADPDMQVRIGGVTHNAILVTNGERLAEVADSDEAIEAAAGVDGDESESAADFQSRENPDFYAVRSLIVTEKDGKHTPSYQAIERIADNYSFD